MKTFEERYTAWIDQRLSPEEQALFEKELESLPEAARDRTEAHRLGELLRKHGAAPGLTNADFFNHQIVHRIRFAETFHESSRPRTWWRWSLPQLVVAGATALLLAFVLFQMMIPPTRSPATASGGGAPYFAEVVDAWPSDPSISVSTVYTPQDNVTLLWLDGLDYLPASYVLK
jgi:hypothetical protein